MGARVGHRGCAHSAGLRRCTVDRTQPKRPQEKSLQNPTLDDTGRHKQEKRLETCTFGGPAKLDTRRTRQEKRLEKPTPSDTGQAGLGKTAGVVERTIGWLKGLSWLQGV